MMPSVSQTASTPEPEELQRRGNILAATDSSTEQIGERADEGKTGLYKTSKKGSGNREKGATD